MNLVREPDAGNPPVRFDEREVETEHGMRLVRHRRGNPETEYVEAYTTAPPLDSTVFVPGCGMVLCFGSPLFGFGMLFIFVGMMMSPILAALALITFLTTECVLTDKRVIGKRGFAYRQSLEILLTKVESVEVRQGVLGRIFDYETITVSGAGGLKTRFSGIAKPLEFRKNVQQQIAVLLEAFQFGRRHLSKKKVSNRR